MAAGLEEVAVAVKFVVQHRKLFQQVLENIPTLVTEIEAIVAAAKGSAQPKAPAQPTDKTVIWGS